MRLHHVTRADVSRGMLRFMLVPRENLCTRHQLRSFQEWFSALNGNFIFPKNAEVVHT